MSDQDSNQGQEIEAFKAFNQDFTCNGFQYEVGKTYQHPGNVAVCSTGFHSCTDPLDVLKYYDITTSRFARVSAGGIISKANDDSKFASGSITIKAELRLPDFIKQAVQAFIAICRKDCEKEVSVEGHYATNASSGDSATNVSSGDYAKNASSGHYATNASSGDSATNVSSGHYAKNASSGHSATNASSGDSATNASSGHYAKNASSGHYATNASSGDYAKNASSGHYAKNASSGDSAKNASSGDSAKNASSGHYAKNASSGHSATNASSGDSAMNASSGDYAKNEATGKDSVIAAAGIGSHAKVGENGCFTLTWHDGKRHRMVTGYSGENGIKPDVWYSLDSAGNFVEA